MELATWLRWRYCVEKAKPVPIVQLPAVPSAHADLVALLGACWTVGEPFSVRKATVHLALQWPDDRSFLFGVQPMLLQGYVPTCALPACVCEAGVWSETLYRAVFLSIVNEGLSSTEQMASTSQHQIAEEQQQNQNDWGGD